MSLPPSSAAAFSVVAQGVSRHFWRPLMFIPSKRCGCSSSDEKVVRTSPPQTTGFGRLFFLFPLFFLFNPPKPHGAVLLVSFFFPPIDMPFIRVFSGCPC